jgi:hypothetical protein
MARYLTVSELVDKCGPALSPEETAVDEERRRIWLRRARHWSTMGILPSAPASRDGTGHHRLYEEKAIYIAAVLLRIADLGVSVNVTRDVAKALQLQRSGTDFGKGFPQCWRQAVAGKPPGNYYLVIWITHDGFVYVDGIGPEQDLGSLPALIEPDDAPVVVLSLTQIFAMVRR